MAADNIIPLLPLIVITGPTASGKSGIAIELAQSIEAEIISADSRTVYKYLNIGTAKPNEDEQGGVKHWGIDIVEPDIRYNVAEFKLYAQKKIEEIRKRGHIPMLVGGTGLYIDAVIFDYKFGPVADLEQRLIFEAMTIQELNDYCIKNNVILPENVKNKRYLIRAIELRDIHTERRNTPVNNTIVVGISTDRNILRTRIEHRTEQLFDSGVVNEARMLGEKYGWHHESMTGNIYPILHSYLDNEITLEQAKEKCNIMDWHLVKRQLTWLRRNQYIVWLPREQVKEYILDRLAK